MLTVPLIVLGAIAFYAWMETMFTNPSDKYEDYDENDDLFI